MESMVQNYRKPIRTIKLFTANKKLRQKLQCIMLSFPAFNKQLSDEVEHDIMNYQNRGLCYLPKPTAEADNTDTRF